MSYSPASGSSKIATSSDVALSNPLDGDVLTYSGSLSKWQNHAAAASYSDPAVFQVDKYHQAGDTDDGASFTRCLAAMVSAGSGIMKLSAKTYTITSLTAPLLFQPAAGKNYLPYAVQGAGRRSSIIKYAGSMSAAVFTINHPSFNASDPTNYGPKWSGFTMDGTGSSGGASAISFSDVSYLNFDDLTLEHFTSGDGFTCPNTYGWTEGTHIGEVAINDCAVCVHFKLSGTYGSYDYWNVTGMYANVNASQSVVMSEVPTGSASSYARVGTYWRMRGNAQKGSTNTGAIFYLKGSDPWDYCTYDIMVEVDGGAAAPHASLNFASAAHMTGFGRFQMYYLGNPVFAGGRYQFGISGDVALYSFTDTSSPGSSNRILFNPFSRNTGSGVSPSGYPGSIANNTSWQNTTGYDVMVSIPITTTGTAGSSCTYNVDTYNSLSNNAMTAFSAPSGTSAGFVHEVKFIHYANCWAKINVTNGTIGAPVVRYA